MSNTPLSIPKIIHQTWKTSEVPEAWAPCIESWRAMHPDWEYRLWTDEDNRNFVAAEFPELLEVFDSYSYGIQRADAIRYLLLYRFGGLYVDLDMECLSPFDDLLAGFQCVFGEEPECHAGLVGKDRILCNATMASIPGHPFIRSLIEGMQERCKILTHKDVLMSTGPMMVSEVYEKYSGDDMTVLESRAFYPYPSEDPRLRPLLLRGERYEYKRTELINHGSYALHYWDNSWGRNLAGTLDNPFPDDVAGYDFYPAKDSFGHDLFNAGSQIDALAEACSACEEAVAFNTQGFVKSALAPKSLWENRKNTAPNEGLYVKTGIQPPNRVAYELYTRTQKFRQKLGL